VQRLVRRFCHAEILHGFADVSRGFLAVVLLRQFLLITKREETSFPVSRKTENDLRKLSLDGEEQGPSFD
jgi:hypothetical protein